MSTIVAIEKSFAYHGIIRNSLAEDYDLFLFHDMDKLTRKAPDRSFDLGIIDLDADETPDFKTVRYFKQRYPHTPIIITSERNDADWIVATIKAGAFDFISKPYSGSRIKLAVKGVIENSSLKNEIDYLRRQQDVIYDLGRIIAFSPVMESVMELVKKYSATDSNILITGETGTGKSFLAGAIHFNSPRKKKPFVKINCANIPETLLESELFGHEKGAFTDAVKTRKGRVEQASQGTVFLDEIGEMSPSLQSKFLQVVEEKKFERLGGDKTIYSDVRIIVATNQDLASMVRRGEFRQDLFFRLNVLAIHLPPLRDRQDCIEPLAYHLLGKVSKSARKKVKGFSPGVLEMMQRYSWPGNIREMANVIERAVLLESTPVITVNSMHLDSGDIIPDSKEMESRVSLEDSEFKLIMNALENCLWVQKKAAAQLGISPRALNYKIKKHGITHWSWRKNKS